MRMPSYVNWMGKSNKSAPFHWWWLWFMSVITVLKTEWIEC